MNLGSNTILITGGASGIGLALADRFLRAGSRVIICGRREDKLREAAATRPQLTTRACDLRNAAERVALCTWAIGEFPQLNLLVNNAGIQRRLALADNEPWLQTADEIAINLDAPIHLARLFIPHLTAQPASAIINITSGLAFAPLAAAPIYCATKAAMHSFTLSLRHQLAATSTAVIEVIPPAVDTDLGGPGLHAFAMPLDEFIDVVMPRLAQGDLEIAHGFAQQSSRASRPELDAIVARMNRN
jgi:uncharacterized oxidoreductase